ncbi:MAG: adenylate/guanylate cyclase domain-containing protein [Gammaproteobacteria bacterium]|nr:adenylate/guanylate cyclase domain-containing protein [Gammaproteobacteria bacterium]MCI0590859.1 adenylate/guanylate cyclase domain-containing protein [Gammaproteobacteria bacterium]
MKTFLQLLKRHLVRVIIGLLVVVMFLLHVSGLLHWRLIDRMENIAYDARLVFTMPNSQDPRIVIVDINEKSLAEEGRWPWSRDRMARFLDQLFNHYHVALVAFDLVFAEPDRSSGLDVLEGLANDRFSDLPEYRARLESIRPKLDYDRLFAGGIKGRPVILGFYYNEPNDTGEVSKSGALPSPTFVQGGFKGRKIDFIRAGGYGGNLAEFQLNAIGGGHFNPWVDEDGTVRRVPMLVEYDGAYYASLSLEVARVILGVAQVEPQYAYTLPWDKRYPGLEWLKLGHHLVPVDGRIRTLVPYRGRQGSFPYASAADVLNGRVAPEILKNAVVLVGATAPGLLDLRATPVQKAFPGVEIHANLISGILDQTIKEKPAYTLGAEFILLLIIGLVMALILPLLTPLWATLVTLLVTVISIGFNFAIWHYANLVLPIASGVIMILVMYLLNMTYGFFVETRRERQIMGLFGQYVPPELVNEMSRDPASYSVEAESRELTVLFSDVRDFTNLSEGLTPKDLSQLMNEFLTPMTQIIHKHRGTIDKYMGDAIMAFWGAPVEDPEHARHALMAGMELLERTYSLQNEFRSRGWPPLRVGVGINTGVMRVGNMGSAFRMAYTVIGDAVNLGSRLEGLTKEYGVPLIVSASTKGAVPEYFYRELDRVRVMGKDEPVAIFEPIGLINDIDKTTLDEMTLYAQALKYYRAEDWDRAELQFLNLQKIAPERGLYSLYIKRVAHFRRHPPEVAWNGVFTYTTKG